MFRWFRPVALACGGIWCEGCGVDGVGNHRHLPHHTSNKYQTAAPPHLFQTSANSPLPNTRHAPPTPNRPHLPAHPHPWTRQWRLASALATWRARQNREREEGGKERARRETLAAAGGRLSCDPATHAPASHSRWRCRPSAGASQAGQRRCWRDCGWGLG